MLEVGYMADDASLFSPFASFLSPVLPPCTPLLPLISQGVYTGRCGVDLNHGVLAVGYTADGGAGSGGAWIVKNSWGPDWGDNGYIYMQRNLQGTNSGICGITTLVSGSPRVL